MAASGRDNGDQSALAMFAAELRAGRAKAGLSRNELAAQLNYSGSLVGMIESMARVPSLEFAQRADTALGTPGTFARMQLHLRAAPFPSWFRPFAQHEQDAIALRTFEHSLVPGLLQVPEYARALLSTRMGTSRDETEQLVTARMDRQAILDRADPPLLWVVIDEHALRRPVGGRTVMAEQLDHLAEMAQRPSILIEVIPLDVGAHEGVNGAFVIADFADAPSIVYLETALTGLVVERPEDVAAVTLSYETLRAEALSRSGSLDKLKEVRQTWT
jgi:transcriptional regulator with XRE-family HTH domain